ncbi:MAG: phage holin family protein [Acetatifactor sp.]|nr:phage holin family protein [Acetatifactor sp.]
MDKVKITVTVVISVLMSWLGILAVPVFLLLGCNLIDYGTGLAAAAKRREQISSYRSIWGIAKKVCQWLLIIVGAMVDMLIKYAVDNAGINVTLPFIVATVVAVWLVVNEMISILENMIDIGVAMPPFLLPLVRYIREQTESKAAILNQNGEDAENQEENHYE